MITFHTCNRIASALLGSAFILNGVACSVQGTYYPVGSGVPARDKPAEITELSQEELDQQGYEKVGRIIRTWDPKEEDRKMFMELRFIGGDDLPSTGLFERKFINSLRVEGGEAGGDLIRREPDLVYQDTSTMPAVNVNGTQWLDDTKVLEFQRLSWSVWRIKE